MSFLYFAILLGLVIFVHEFGHFIFAKMLGVKVERFSLGFGPKIAGFTWGETEYQLAAFPLGGYVKMLGEDNTPIEDAGVDGGGDVDDKPRELTPEEKARAYNNQPYWKRAMIIFMGPAFNFVFAVLVFWGLVWAIGHRIYLPTIGNVVVNSPAARSGFVNGDTVTAIDGAEIKTWLDMSEVISNSTGKPLKITVWRGDASVDLTVTPEARDGKTIFGEKVTRGAIGIVSALDYIEESVGPFEALRDGIGQAWFVCEANLLGIVKMVQGILSPENLGGPILMYQLTKKQVAEGIEYYISLIGAISATLGLFNLFPIPLLDGGHLSIMTIEFVRRKPLSEKFHGIAQRVGLALIVMLIVFVFYNDITRVINGKELP